MSHDLVAVQRDAALLDHLAQRSWPDAEMHRDADPVAGLLAALAADVDEGLPAVAGPEAVPLTPLIPEQGGRGARLGTVLSLPLAPPAVGRRHVARAVAAMVVTAAVLSASGVAAAVSGDPLTPYKRVIDVVRSGYAEVVPKGPVVPRPTVVPPPATDVVPRAVAAVDQARDDVGTRASRDAAGRHVWDRHVGDRAGWDRAGWDRHRTGRHDRDGRQGHGRQGDGSTGGDARSGHDRFGQHGAGQSGGGSRADGDDGRDSGEHGDRWGDPRR